MSTESDRNLDQPPFPSPSRTGLMICGIISVVGAWHLRGDFFAHFLAIPAALLLLLPVVAMLRTSFGLGAGVYLSTVALSWAGGWLLNRNDIACAMEFPRLARPAIEAHLRTHRDLPDSLANVSNLPPIPRCLVISVDGASVSYRIDSRVHPWDSWSYRASDDTWHHFSM